MMSYVRAMLGAAALLAVISPLPVLAQTVKAPVRSKAGTEVQVPDSARLMRTLSVLAHDSMAGRATGTAGSVKAQKFLLEEFRKRGLEPYGGTSLSHTFRIPASRQATNRDSVDATNIIGMIRGTKYPGRYIAVSAHYDHLGIRNNDVFNGADDNASGTAGILEVASWFAANPPAHSILILAIDAEERGSQGSRAMLRLNKGLADSVLVNINLDMIGRNAKNELYAAGTTPYPFLAPYIRTAAARTRIRLLTGHDAPGTALDDWSNQSDHGSFHALGIPYIYFGEEDHPDYHRATDELPGIMPGFYTNAVRIVLDVVKQIDAKPFTRPVSK